MALQRLYVGTLNETFELEGDDYIWVNPDDSTTTKRAPAPCVVWTPEERIRHGKAISEGKMGYKHTEETKDKISETLKASPIPLGFAARELNHEGDKNPFYGRKHTEESRRLMSEKAKARRAEVLAQTKAKVKQVLALISEGLTHREACGIIGMSINTFRSHKY